MSEARNAFANAARVPVWTRPSASAGFRPRGSDAGSFSPWGQAEGADHGFHNAPSNDLADAEALMAQGFADGLEEGRRQALAELEEERVALARLATALEVLKPQNSDGLATMLADTVKRMVAQIVGETEIDTATLIERAQSAAALIAEGTAPSRMRLHPTDVVRLQDAKLPVELVGDPMLAPGTIVLDTGKGWIEDGPNVRLEKLRAQLDRLGGPK
jgi:flagellar assembly protein FliH